MFFKSQEDPPRCTNTRTFGKFPSFSAVSNFFFKESKLIKPFLGSISTKSTEEPQYLAQFADATKVIGEVQTISFEPNPKDRHAVCKALVALL